MVTTNRDVAGDAARELDEVSAELVTRRDERARLATGIDPELLELYEDLRPQKKGVAAVFQPGASLEQIVDFVRATVPA